MCGKYLKYAEVFVERRTLDKTTAHTAKLRHQLHLRQFTSVGGGNAVLALTDTQRLHYPPCLAALCQSCDSVHGRGSRL